MIQKIDTLKRYLDRYAEEEVAIFSKSHLFSISCHQKYDHCLVIPACNEDFEFLSRLKKSLLAQQKLLIIVVINQPENQPDNQTPISQKLLQVATAENQLLWQNITNSGEAIFRCHHFQMVQWSDTRTDIVAIDRFSGDRAISAKQGVGLARKIGCDIACKLIQQKILEGPWIHCSDADTHLADDYFEIPDLSKRTSAILYPFIHKGKDDAITKATLLYERSLHYYVNGLKMAGSTYAFHTIGSCLAVHVDYYAKVRGFPKRAGAEDFYLLNKLAKLARVTTLNNSPVQIKSRLSERAPFGTGISVKKILQQAYSENNYPVYHPQVFRELKRLLAHLPSLYENSNRTDLWMAQNSRASQNALEAIGIQSLFKHLQKQISSEKQWQIQCHCWFDAFRTLKFIHQLETNLPKVALIDAESNLLNPSVWFGEH